MTALSPVFQASGKFKESISIPLCGAFTTTSLA